MSILLNDNVNVAAPKPTDHRYGPYATVAAALAAIVPSSRYTGLTVGITTGGITEDYWFRVGIADVDLVVKTTSGVTEYYRHVQGSPASVWNVTHNLNKYPSITVVDSSGSAMIGDTQHTSLNTVTITFSAAFSGEAYFN